MLNRDREITPINPLPLTRSLCVLLLLSTSFASADDDFDYFFDNDGPNTQFKLTFKRSCVPSEAILKPIASLNGEFSSEYQMNWDTRLMSLKGEDLNNKVVQRDYRLVDLFTSNCYEALNAVPSTQGKAEDDKFILWYTEERFPYYEFAVFIPKLGADFVVRVFESKKQGDKRLEDFIFKRTQSLFPEFSSLHSGK